MYFRFYFLDTYKFVRVIIITSKPRLSSFVWKNLSFTTGASACFVIRMINTMASNRRENILGYLPFDITSFSKLLVLWGGQFSSSFRAYFRAKWWLFIVYFTHFPNQEIESMSLSWPVLYILHNFAAQSYEKLQATEKQKNWPYG